MDVFALNSGTVNSSGSNASVVLLPTSTSTVGLALYERISVSMEGIVDLSFDAVGDIARVSNLGNGQAESNFGLVGQVATVILGPSAVSYLGLEAAGSLLRIGGLVGQVELFLSPASSLTATKYFGTQSTESGFAAIGSLQRTLYLTGASLFGFSYPPPTLTSLVGMEGTSTSVWSSNASLNQGYISLIPAGVALYGFTLNAAIRSTQSLAGEVKLDKTVSGNMSYLVFMEGTAVVSYNLQSALSNNAAGYDLERLLMIRPKSIREMTR